MFPTLSFFIVHVPFIACFVECYSTPKLPIYFNYIRLNLFVHLLHYIFRRFSTLAVSSKFFSLVCFSLYGSLHAKITVSSSLSQAQFFRIMAFISIVFAPLNSLRALVDCIS